LAASLDDQPLSLAAQCHGMSSSMRIRPVTAAYRIWCEAAFCSFERA